MITTAGKPAPKPSARAAIRSCVSSHRTRNVAELKYGIDSRGRVDGTYYGFMGSVSWFDRQGGLHLDGWPECLTDQTRSAHFEAASQEIDLIGKPVLAVDCR